MAPLAPKRGASEAELEVAPMSLPILLQAMVFLLRASQSPSRAPFPLPRQQPTSTCTGLTRAERSQLSLQPSLAWCQQERLVWFGKDLSGAVALGLGDTTSALYNFSVVSLSVHRSWASVLGSLTP